MAKLLKFKSEKQKEPYIITRECIADGFTSTMSKLYHDMRGSKVIEIGEKYTSTEVPHGYFKYKGKVWPVYIDDAGQCEYIYINGVSYGGGTYNLDPVEEFIAMIDQFDKEEK